MAELEIIHPGSYCSLQDGGRTGYGGWGVPRSGTCFPKLMRIANALVGNDLNCVGLEFFMKGPKLKAKGGAIRIAVAGSNQLTIMNGQKVSPFQSFILEEGETLDIALSDKHKGGFVAIEGGVDIKPVLGSCSTYARSSIGGVNGQNIKPGDRLPVTKASSNPDQFINYDVQDNLPENRVILGPQDDYFDLKNQRVLFENDYEITAQSDRMGVRLSGQKLEHIPEKGAQIISDTAQIGAIQVPGDGAPIILLNDAQSVGGYPKIGCVLSCDIELIANALAGSKIRFVPISQADGIKYIREDHQQFQKQLESIRTVFSKENLDPSVLYEQNLISGVIYETNKDPA